MTDYKRLFDVFVCGGSQHVGLLRPLLARLLPYGTVHLASCFLSPRDLELLRGLYDALHTPAHSPDGYTNFELFVIRDINRLASAPYFIKLDADVQLAEDWVGYVEECIAAHPDAVLFGPRRGNVDVNFRLSGELARMLLRRDVNVAGAPKVIGGFYVGKTSFFKDHMRFMEIVHEFMWCFKGGVRHRPSVYPGHWPARALEECVEPLTMTEGGPRFQGNEDTLRSLVVHAVGAGDRLHVIDSRGRVRIHRGNTMNP